jgi:hypothetical protein
MVILASKGGLNLFIDCTFDVVPHPFTQMMVIMLYDEATQLYLPVFHVLLQSKHEDAYIEAIHQCIVAANHKMDGISITCDFEKGLINACKSQFPRAFTVLCEFHFKQCLRRKLLPMKFEQDTITELIGPNGFIECLFVLPPDEISSYGNYFTVIFTPTFNILTRYLQAYLTSDLKCLKDHLLQRFGMGSGHISEILG